MATAAAALTVGSVLVIAPDANAAFTTCSAWRTASWGRNRMCHDDRLNAWGIQYQDTLTDGHPVNLAERASSANTWNKLFTMPDGSIQSLVLDSETANWSWRIDNNVNTLMVCNARDGNPPPVSGVPTCFNE